MRIIVAVLFLLLSACATIGPQIASEDERKAREMLMAESQAWRQKQQQRIDEIAGRLVNAAGPPSTLRFIFVGTMEQTGGRIHPDAVNAWTDGEGVWITRGMMRFLKSDDEVAAVLSHEMAHALRGHMRYLWAQNLLGLVLTIPAAKFGGRIGAEVAQWLVQAATTKFGRDREREADLYGLIWLHRAGFNVGAAKEVFKKMAIEMPESAERGFLSSHPSSAERLLAMERVAETLGKGLDPLKVFAPQDGQTTAEETQPIPASTPPLPAP